MKQFIKSTITTVTVFGLMIVMIIGTSNAGASDFNATTAEAEFTETTHEINKADKELAERMCEVCKVKIARYKKEINAQPIANDMEIKTLSTYEARLHKFCALKNELSN